MDKIYFKCDWVVDPEHLEYVFQAYQVADELGCELVRDSWSYITPEDIGIQPFAICVPSQEILTEFIEKVGEQMGLSTWIPIDENTFSQWERLHPREIPVRQGRIWVDNMIRVGGVNKWKDQKPPWNRNM